MLPAGGAQVGVAVAVGGAVGAVGVAEAGVRKGVADVATVGEAVAAGSRVGPEVGVGSSVAVGTAVAVATRGGRWSWRVTMSLGAFNVLSHAVR